MVQTKSLLLKMHMLLSCRLMHMPGSAVLFEAEWLGRLIPDVNEHTSAARPIWRLLHPDPARRPTVQQALDADFLQP